MWPSVELLRRLYIYGSKDHIVFLRLFSGIPFFETAFPPSQHGGRGKGPPAVSRPSTGGERGKEASSSLHVGHHSAEWYKGSSRRLVHAVYSLGFWRKSATSIRARRFGELGGEGGFPRKSYIDVSRTFNVWRGVSEKH